MLSFAFFLLHISKSYPTFPNCWLTSSPTPCGLVCCACCFLRRAWSCVPHRSTGDRGDTSLPPGQLDSWVAGRLSLALCTCHCQTRSHWGGDRRIGEKLLAKAVLEVPLARFCICSRRVDTVGGDGRPNADRRSGVEHSGATRTSFWGRLYVCSSQWLC